MVHRNIYDEVRNILDSYTINDKKRLKDIFSSQEISNDILKKMIEEVITLNIISPGEWYSFFYENIKDGNRFLIDILINFSDIYFYKGGYKFLIDIIKEGNPDVIGKVKDIFKNKKVSEDVINYIKEIIINSHDKYLIEFFLDIYPKKLKNLWIQIVKDNGFSLDLRLAILDVFRGLKEASFSRVLEVLCNDPEPVIADTAKRILKDIYGKFNLKRDYNMNKRIISNKNVDINSIWNQSKDNFIYFGLGFFVFLIIHVIFGEYISPIFTYILYWIFIIYGGSLGWETGILLTVVTNFLVIVFYILNFTPNFVPSWIVLFVYLAVGISISYISNLRAVVIRDARYLKKENLQLSNRLKVLEEQLSDNLEAIQDIKKKLMERTIKLYTLMTNIREITSSIDIDKIANAISEILFKGLNTKEGQIFLVDKEMGIMYTIKNFIVRDKNLNDRPNFKLLIYENPIFSLIFKKKEIITPLDVKQYPDIFEAMKSSRIDTTILAPLVVDNEVKAVINIKRDNKNIDEDDITLLSAITSSAAIALKNAEVFNIAYKELDRVKKLGLRERKKQQMIRAMFSKYVSPNVVDKILEDGVNLGGDYFNVAILLLDIRGFTSFSENTPPERVVDLLNTFFSMVTGIILDNDGTVDKYMGDAILSFFGAPIQIDKPYINAIKCALKIKDRIKDAQDVFMRNYNFKLSIGQTINYGKAVIGNIGSEKRMEYTAIGDVVNTAARLEDLAASDHILIPESLYNLVRDKIEAEKIGRFELKGKQEKITVYNILGWKGII